MTDDDRFNLPKLFEFLVSGSSYLVRKAFHNEPMGLLPNKSFSDTTFLKQYSRIGEKSDEPNSLSPIELEELLDIYAFRLKVLFETQSFTDDQRAEFIQKLADRVSGKVTLPNVAPELWAERADRRSENPVDFIKRVYGRSLNAGLTRAHLRDLDRPLYQALSTWLRRHPEPDGMGKFLENPRAEPSEVDKRLQELGIVSPADAYARLPDDRKEADRLYQAALRRQKNMSPT